MTTAMHEEWGAASLLDGPPHLRQVAPPPPRRRFPGWALLAVFPLAVVLTVFAIGGVDGRTPARVRIDLRDGSGDLPVASRLADRLSAAGMQVVGVRPVEPGGVAPADTQIHYARDAEGGAAKAKAVRRALGTGTIVRSSDVGDGVDVMLVIGKDVQNE